MIFFKRCWRDHNLIGFGLYPAGVSGMGVFSQQEAFLSLQDEPAVKVTASMDHVLLDATEGHLPNVAAAWGWSPSSVESFLSNLQATGFITSDLLQRLIDRLPRKRTFRTRLSTGSREEVLAKTSGKCVYCGTGLTTRSGYPNSYHADHVLAVSNGGNNDIGNLVPCCQACNLKKGSKTALRFMGGQS